MQPTRDKTKGKIRTLIKNITNREEWIKAWELIKNNTAITRRDYQIQTELLEKSIDYPNNKELQRQKTIWKFYKIRHVNYYHIKRNWKKPAKQTNRKEKKRKHTHNTKTPPTPPPPSLERERKEKHDDSDFSEEYEEEGLDYREEA